MPLEQLPFQVKRASGSGTFSRHTLYFYLNGMTAISHSREIPPVRGKAKRRLHVAASQHTNVYFSEASALFEL